MERDALLRREEELRLLDERLNARTSDILARADSIIKKHLEDERVASSGSAGTVSDAVGQQRARRVGTPSKGSVTGSSLAASPPSRGPTWSSSISPRARALLQQPSLADADPADGGAEAALAGEDYDTGLGLAQSTDLFITEPAPQPQPRQDTSADGGSISSQMPASARERVTPRGRQEQLSPAELAALATADRVGDDLPASLGTAATIRAQRTRIAMLQEGLQKLAQEKSLLENEVNSLKVQLKAVEEDRKKLRRNLQNAEGSLDRQRKEAQALESKAAALEREVATLRKELEASEKARKQQEQESKNQLLKLNRALQDAERFKARLEKQDSQRGASDATQKELAKLRTENKRLQQQKTELINACKKQLKLIDILRRQKLHAEAARMLSFSEEEFAKTLELG